MDFKPLSTTLVDIQKLSKIFSKNAAPSLQGINAIIPKGEVIGLVGPDGAGKTTMLRLIAGLLKPTEGTITVDGYDTIKNADTIRYLIGYMPQKFGLYEDLTVMQNLNLYADLRGIPVNEKDEIFKELLHFTDLGRFTDRLSGALSGGMKQKLGLACALIKKPKLLLLDEPTVGVDPISRRELWKMVHELLREDISVIWSTAYLEEAERCQTVLILNEGKLIYQGPPEEMTHRADGRTFKITHLKENRRNILEKALQDKNVVDGIIQGNDLRIVTKNKTTPPIDLSTLKIDPAAELVSTPPRFEDAFIDFLGGGPGGVSLLAEKTPKAVPKHHIMIETHDLTKCFGSFTAANKITLSIPAGEVFGLLGPNGAGKSTTFKMMCGLLVPTSGSAHVNGVDLLKAPGRARSHIGYMAQKFSLYGDLTVKQNLKFFSGIYNLSGKKQRDAIDQMVDVFSLKPYLNESPEVLPLGFKQRLAFSCAVMHHPEVLFLDEPTSGVDPITRREFWNHINGLVQKGVTVMITTHFMDEAEYCDRIGLVYRSKLIAIGTPDELRESAKTKDNPSPTLEDAFIQLITRYDVDSYA